MVMFCPICRCGYREGFTTCADCRVALVAELPPLPGENHAGEDQDRFVEVFSTADVGEIAVIKSVFDGYGIPYIADADHFVSLVRVPTQPVRFFVPASQFDAAKELLKDVRA